MNKQPSTVAREFRAEERLKLRWQMAIQRRIELSMNQLIQNMVGLVDETQIANSGMEKHQIKNLLKVALETPGAEVVKHYIFYQIGRDVSGTNWRHNEFGQKLVKKISDLRTKEAKRITDDVFRELASTKSSETEGLEKQIDEAWILLVRAYLGQLNRYFYYRKEGHS